MFIIEGGSEEGRLMASLFTSWNLQEVGIGFINVMVVVNL